MIRIVACCLALALGVYVFAVGLYSVLPTQHERVAHPTLPAADEKSLAVLAEDAILPTATVSSPQSILAGNAVLLSHPVVEAPPEAADLQPAPESSPALAPALKAVALPTVTPTPQPLRAIVFDPTPAPVATTSVESIPSAPDGCTVAAPPPSLGLDPFYTKYCSALGIPIVASSEVPDAALHRAWEIVTHMLNGITHAEELQTSIIRTATRIGIIGAAQATTDMPEHRTLYTLFPNVDWNTRARGVGATLEIPLLSIAEENLLCYPGDQWAGQNVLVHEFAHTVKNLGLDLIDPAFHAEVQHAYQQALNAGLWPETYVSSNIEEYWAEGVRLYFQQDAAGVPGGQSYPANSRAELARYDPELYRLVETVFGPRTGIAPCPG